MARVFWIKLSRVYDITFREEDSLAGARRKAISVGVDPEGVDTTVYVPGD